MRKSRRVARAFAHVRSVNAIKWMVKPWSLISLQPDAGNIKFCPRLCVWAAEENNEARYVAKV